MRLHLSHVCMFSPIGPSAWKTSPLKQWSSAPQWRAHGGGGAGENSLTCCWSTRCNCSNKQSLSTLKILKMLQILKCIFFVVIILFLLSCFDWIYDVFFATKQSRFNRLLMMSSGIWFPRRAPKRSRGPRRKGRKRIDQMVITQNVFIWYVTSFISIYIYTVYPTWSNIYNVCVWLVWGPPPPKTIWGYSITRTFFCPPSTFFWSIKLRKDFNLLSIDFHLLSIDFNLLSIDFNLLLIYFQLISIYFQLISIYF